jgi:signal transduction histidine kinase
MNRGLGSFIEGKSTLSGWQSGSDAAAFVDESTFEGDLNSKQQSLQVQQHELAHNAVSPGENIEARPTRDSSQHIERPSEDRNGNWDCESPAGVFAKAANIIRESTEVEGCLFVDATMEAYRSPSQTNTSVNTMGLFSAASSSDDSLDHAPSGQSCRVLAHACSTSDKSSIDGDASKQHAIALPDKFLAKLLRRYPKGKVFNFGADGVLQPPDSSEDDGNLSPSEFAEKLSLLSNRRDNIPNLSTHDKPPKKPWARHREGTILLKAFPGVQSVAFTPVWDPRKDRWYAGCFIYTNIVTRNFTVEGELSYLRAFGMLTMAEILRANDLQVDKAKSDILGSLSHELRSPLHGIILSAELLGDTRLSVFQGNAAHTIELCSRTLLDTIDHLLDYSKINSFARKGSKSKVSRGPQPVAVVDDPGKFSEKSLTCDTRLDRLIEEVIESVFAGYTFQYLSITQPSAKQAVSINGNAIASHEPNPIQTMLQIDPIPAAGLRLSQEFGEVSVILSIDARQDWSYFVQVGAIRRIVMNIFGNALKYTPRGTIKVSLTQERHSIQRGQKQQVVKFTVQDTGKGIGPDFLQHDLFRPFSQEDTLTPGTGLGLSLVKQIVSQLRGEVSVQSQVGIGTTASVILPLERVSQSPENPLRGSEDDQMFEEQVRDLKGLRIGLSLSNHTGDGNISNWQKSVPDICREWLMMEIVSNIPGTTTADIVLWSHDGLPSLSKDIEALTKTPNVVICPNALVAYRQSKFFEAADYAAVFEFISQPYVYPYTLFLHCCTNLLMLSQNRPTQTCSGSVPCVYTMDECL